MLTARAVHRSHLPEIQLIAVATGERGLPARPSDRRPHSIREPHALDTPAQTIASSTDGPTATAEHLQPLRRIAFRSSPRRGGRTALQQSAFGTSDHSSDPDSPAVIHLGVCLGHKSKQIVGTVRAFETARDVDHSGQAQRTQEGTFCFMRRLCGWPDHDSLDSLSVPASARFAPSPPSRTVYENRPISTRSPAFRDVPLGPRSGFRLAAAPPPKIS